MIVYSQSPAWLGCAERAKSKTRVPNGSVVKVYPRVSGDCRCDDLPFFFRGERSKLWRSELHPVVAGGERARFWWSSSKGIGMPGSRGDEERGKTAIST